VVETFFKPVKVYIVDGANLVFLIFFFVWHFESGKCTESASREDRIQIWVQLVTELLGGHRLIWPWWNLLLNFAEECSLSQHVKVLIDDAILFYVNQECASGINSDPNEMDRTKCHYKNGKNIEVEVTLKVWGVGAVKHDERYR
jgi:hypothetical protein